MQKSSSGVTMYEEDNLLSRILTQNLPHNSHPPLAWIVCASLSSLNSPHHLTHIFLCKVQSKVYLLSSRENPKTLFLKTRNLTAAFAYNQIPIFLAAVFVRYVIP